MKKLWHCSIAAAVIAAAVVLTGYSLAQAAGNASNVPHGTVGFENCLGCHGVKGAQSIPSSHASFNNSACAGCHSPATSTDDKNCLTCHAQRDLSLTFPGGEKLSLYVDSQMLATSIHGDKLSCGNCHSSITGYPHPRVEASTVRQYSIAGYEMCKRCHFDNYTKALDSVHYKTLSAGGQGSPLCTDCHGAHNITAAGQPRAEISQTCSRCHQSVYNAYAGSVHGKSLTKDSSNDVPVCTDCHLTHAIEDARTAAFRLKSVDLCSKCHGDEKLMQKYGISSNVVKTYLQDFHGTTVALIEKQDKNIWAKEAVCTDCHGVHDIQRADDPASPVIKANLVDTCRQCHPNATADFPAAWLSHYEPSPRQAPLVFYVRWFYRLFIPFILVGLAVHISLDLWQTLKKR